MAETAINILSAMEEELETIVASNATMLKDMKEGAKKKGTLEDKLEIAKNMKLKGIDILTIIENRQRCRFFFEVNKIAYLGVIIYFFKINTCNF
ncbi:MAG: hypothetical protein RSA29_00440 [Clostridium sp.]|uniref:hypothetical protein n=1 Tax=Clostridium sp. TaxID=1506 RepID=UPI0030544E45